MQQRRAPFPEPDQCDQHNQADRFIQSFHEQVDVLFHLEWLIRGARDDQIGRKRGADLLHLFVDCRAELLDLLAGSHEYGDRNRSIPVHVAIFAEGSIKIQNK